MNCPKCGKENPDQFCNFCNTPLIPSQTVSKKIDVRISKIALASFACSLFAVICFMPGLVAILDPRTLNPKSEIVESVACANVLIGSIAFILGVIALSSIGTSGGRMTGKGFAAIGTVVPLILIFILFWFNIGKWYAAISPRMVCGTNLSGIGKAMLIYSNEVSEKRPVFLLIA